MTPRSGHGQDRAQRTRLTPGGQEEVTSVSSPKNMLAWKETDGQAYKHTFSNVCAHDTMMGCASVFGVDSGCIANAEATHTFARSPSLTT